MAKKHINKNKFKGSLETIFTDITCYKTELDFSDDYYTICKNIWKNYPDTFPSPIVGPVPFNISGYVGNNRPCFQQPPYTHCSQWPVLITPSGVAVVNNKDSNLSPLNFPLGPYTDSSLFKIDRIHIFIGSEKLITKYSDINDIKKYPQYWKEVWCITLDLGLYGIPHNVYGKVVLSERVFSDTTKEWLLRQRRRRG